MPAADGAFDYVIVGAGSSGCALANRLSADPRCRVLLLEAGPADRHPFIHMPKGLARVAADPRHTWQFPSKRVGGKPETVVKGRTLGGSSAINAMIYTRGQPADFAQWVAVAGAQWGADAMFGAMRAIEDHALGEGGGRGVGGPLHVGRTAAPDDPLPRAAIAAGRALGLPERADINADGEAGIGCYHYTIRHGRRVSAADAFLHPVRQRRNLCVATGVEVAHILFDGRRAVGVEGRRGGQPVRYRAAGEIILSAGAVMTPAILQRSGVGPGDVLRDAGVDLLCDSPHVGARLLDHLGVALQYRLHGIGGLNRQLRGWRLVLAAADYALRRRGPLATGLYEVGGFVRTRPGLARPDAQIYVGAYSFRRTPSGGIAAHLGLDAEPGVTIYGQHLQPRSEGHVRIHGPGLDDAPVITPNWLADPADVEATAALLVWLRHFMRQPPLAPFVGRELTPGPELPDARLLEALPRIASTGQHMVGSCRMGRAATDALDPDLRVRGVDGLRVADCSAMPGMISGNSNAAAMAFGWLAADIIRREKPPAPQIGAGLKQGPTT